jgi:hypothetical protein
MAAPGIIEIQPTQEATTKAYVWTGLSPAAPPPPYAPGEHEAVIVLFTPEPDRAITAVERDLGIRPVADMSEWTADLDAEALAIRADLAEASFRTLGDD